MLCLTARENITEQPLQEEVKDVNQDFNLLILNYNLMAHFTDSVPPHGCDKPVENTLTESKHVQLAEIKKDSSQLDPFFIEIGDKCRFPEVVLVVI